MCGSGVQGAVSFPGYMSDTHGLLLQDHVVDNAGDYVGAITSGTFTLSLVDILNDAWTADAYSSFTFTSPTTDLAASKTQFDGFYSHVTGLVHTTDWDVILTKAADKLGSCSSMKRVSIDELAQSALGKLKDAVEESLSYAQEIMDDINAGGTGQSQTAYNLGFDLLPDLSTTIQQEVLSQVSTAYNNAFTQSGDLITTVMNSTLPQTTSAVKHALVMALSINTSVVKRSKTVTSEAIREALAVAQELVETSVLDPLVTEFDNRQSIPRARAVATFNQQMVDGNAIHSSAFLIGHALLQAEFSRQTADFNAQLTANSYQENLRLWVQGWIQQSQLEGNIRLEGLRSWLAAWNNQAQREALLRLQTLQVWLSAWANQSGTEGQIRLEGLRTYLSAWSDQARIETTTRVDGLRTLLSGWGAQSQVEASTRQNNMNQMAQTLREGVGHMVRMLTDEVEFERAASVMLTDQNRVKVVALAEHEERNLDKTVRADLWDLEVLSEAMAVVAGPAGGGRALPNKPSRVSSALGMGLQGAAAGASTGGAIGTAIQPGGGTAIGAGIGAFVGGTIGTIGGLTQ